MPIPFIKTQSGEHDYHKPACSEYCRMGGEFCPFVHNGRTKVEGIVRWTDIADMDNAVVLGGNASSNGYSADFSGKQVHSPSQEDDFNGASIRAEYGVSHYTCWGDGSGFEYDQMSRNIMGPGGVAESVYDISNYGIDHAPLQFSEWNAWIDKFQYDYRFGRVSDTNAECILFPNVDNPWMFTEYVFKGIGGDSEKCALKMPSEYVVEPPVYDPVTLEIVNADLVLASASDYDGKYANDVRGIDVTDSDEYIVHRYRRLTNWGDLTHWTLDEAGGDATALAKLNSTSVSLDSKDSGIRLYRARIPVQSVKWGEHGNIPPHTLDMTAPEKWFDPASTVTKMKVVYDAVVGSSLESPYDGMIYWEGNQAYVATDMEFTAVSVGGRHRVAYSDGSPLAVAMPSRVQNGQNVLLKPHVKIMPDDSHGEFCHGGCANLIGIDGTLRCKLIENGDTSYNPLLVAGNCMNSGSYGGSGEKCAGYVGQRRHPYIATYQDEVKTVDQMTMNLSAPLAAVMVGGIAGGATGALIGGANGASMLATQADRLAEHYKNMGKRGDVAVTYVARYEPVMSGNMLAQLNNTKYN